jgi:hypothetical protein
LNYYEKQVIFPVHLLDEIDNSYQNFGLNIVLNEVYKKFESCIIGENDLKKLKKYLNVKENENNKIYDDEKEKLQKEKIFNILDGNILYKYIKKMMIL